MANRVEVPNLIVPDAGASRSRHARQPVLEEGCRMGRYVLLRDADGCLYALTATAVSALCECDDGCLLLIAGGRVVRTTHSLAHVLGWLI